MEEEGRVEGSSRIWQKPQVLPSDKVYQEICKNKNEQELYHINITVCHSIMLITIMRN